MTFIDLIGISAACFTTISFVPQAIKVIRTKNTEGISLYMYIIFTAGTFLWLCYGILTHDFPITFANAITFMLSSIILFFKIRVKK